jgi:hypothetical protein
MKKIVDDKAKYTDRSRREDIKINAGKVAFTENRLYSQNSGWVIIRTV